VIWTYPGGTLVTFSQFNATASSASVKNAEIEFRGTKGTLFVYGSGYEIVPDRITPNAFPVRTPIDRTVERGWRTGAATQIEPKSATARVEDADHARSFLDAVKSRSRGPCDIEVGHRDTSAAILGNIAHKTGSVLHWDAKAERFTNNEKANRLLSYEYRKPYRLPE
jgi:predicted dehydrogenase